jgi:hypothetical protein
MRRVLLVVLLVAALAGCGDDDDAATTTTSTTASTTSTSTTTTSTTAFDGATTPTSVPTHATSTALLTAVDVAPGLVTFTFRADTPGVDAGYVDPPITQDASGREVDVAGRAFLRIRMEPASGVDLASGDPNPEQTYDGPDRLPGAGGIAEVVRTGDFEANLTWVIGLDAQVPYRVEADASMVRVYIST